MANRSGCGAEEEGKTAAGRQAGRGVAAGEVCEGQRIMDRPSVGGYSAGRRGRRVRV